jgi:Icc protein
LQLTDTHLFAAADGTLFGQNTRQTLDLVIDLALRDFWPVDRILLTGDLVHDESEEGYRYLAARLRALDTPCSCLPGNHDAFRTMKGVLADGPLSLEHSLLHGAWNLLLLDSTIPGQDGGLLDQEQLRMLDRALAGNPSSHALICLHHQPVPVGSDWMDEMALANAEELFAVTDRYPQVRAILWGHIHQDFKSRRKGALLLGSPSTCVQFLPASRHFAIDSLTPGYRWLELHPDGRIETGVVRIAAYPASSAPGAEGR